MIRASQVLWPAGFDAVVDRASQVTCDRGTQIPARIVCCDGAVQLCFVAGDGCLVAVTGRTAVGGTFTRMVDVIDLVWAIAEDTDLAAIETTADVGIFPTEQHWVSFGAVTDQTWAELISGVQDATRDASERVHAAVSGLAWDEPELVDAVDGAFEDAHRATHCQTAGLVAAGNALTTVPVGLVFQVSLLGRPELPHVLDASSMWLRMTVGDLEVFYVNPVANSF